MLAHTNIDYNTSPKHNSPNTMEYNKYYVQNYQKHINNPKNNKNHIINNKTILESLTNLFGELESKNTREEREEDNFLAKKK